MIRYATLTHPVLADISGWVDLGTKDGAGYVRFTSRLSGSQWSKWVELDRLVLHDEM